MDQSSYELQKRGLSPWLILTAIFTSLLITITIGFSLAAFFKKRQMPRVETPIATRAG